MKKYVANPMVILLVVGLVLVMGCARRQAPGSEGTHVSSTSTSGEKKASAEVDYAALAGEYVFEIKEVDPVNYPTLILREDQTSTFRANLLTHMGNFQGTYALEGQKIRFFVEEKDFDGFACDQVQELRFDLSGGGGLLYRGSDQDEEQVIGMTSPYDLFKRSEEVSSEEG